MPPHMAAPGTCYLGVQVCGEMPYHEYSGATLVIGFSHAFSPHRWRFCGVPPITSFASWRSQAQAADRSIHMTGRDPPMTLGDPLVTPGTPLVTLRDIPGDPSGLPR